MHHQKYRWVFLGSWPGLSKPCFGKWEWPSIWLKEFRRLCFCIGTTNWLFHSRWTGRVQNTAQNWSNTRHPDTSDFGCCVPSASVSHTDRFFWHCSWREWVEPQRYTTLPPDRRLHCSKTCCQAAFATALLAARTSTWQSRCLNWWESFLPIHWKHCTTNLNALSHLMYQKMQDD